MLRGEVRIQRAVVVGDGPLAAPMLQALRDAPFCAEASAQSGVADLDKADLVIIDAPASETAAIVRDAIARVSPGAMVTELCPVKSALLATLEADVPPGYGFVACTVFPAATDPIAGSAVTISPLMGSVPAALERMRGVWEQLGAARVLQVDPAAQDLWVAARQIASPQARLLAEEAAGPDSLGGDPAGIGTEDALAMNRDFLGWLHDRIHQPRPDLP